MHGREKVVPSPLSDLFIFQESLVRNLANSFSGHVQKFCDKRCRNKIFFSGIYLHVHQTKSEKNAINFWQAVGFGRPAFHQSRATEPFPGSAFFARFTDFETFHTSPRFRCMPSFSIPIYIKAQYSVTKGTNFSFLSFKHSWRLGSGGGSRSGSRRRRGHSPPVLDLGAGPVPLRASPAASPSFSVLFGGVFQVRRSSPSFAAAPGFLFIFAQKKKTAPQVWRGFLLVFFFLF